MLLKRLIFACLLLIMTQFSNAQIEFGMKAGISSNNLSVGDLIFQKDDMNISLANANYGHHFGFYSRIELISLYIEPSVLFNSSKINYNIKEYSESPISTVVSETYLDMNIPVMVGIKMGILRFYGGPMAKVNLEKTSELVDFDNYSTKIKETTYAYQLGLGLDLWSFRFDVNYENNFSDYGDKISIAGATFSNDTNQARWMATIGIKL
jgi:hypothetical protein